MRNVLEFMSHVNNFAHIKPTVKGKKGLYLYCSRIYSMGIAMEQFKDVTHIITDTFKLSCEIDNHVIVRYSDKDFKKAKDFPWSDYWVVKTKFHPRNKLGDFIFKRSRNDLVRLRADMLHLCKSLSGQGMELKYKVEYPEIWLKNTTSLNSIKKELLLDAEIRTLQTVVKRTDVCIDAPKCGEHFISGYIRWISIVPREEFPSISSFDFKKIKLRHKSDKYRFVFHSIEHL